MECDWLFSEFWCHGRRANFGRSVSSNAYFFLIVFDGFILMETIRRPIFFLQYRIMVEIYISLRARSPEEEFTQAKLGSELGGCLAVPLDELDNKGDFKVTQIETASFV